MPPCHVKPFLRQPAYEPPAASEENTPDAEPTAVAQNACDYCGSPSLVWRKCKLICSSCHQINKSCADL